MRRRIKLVVAFYCTILFSLVMGGKCLSQPAEEVELPALESWTQLPEDHQEIDLKTPCMGCHDLKVDATTTATKQMIRLGKRLDKEILWKRITDYLGNGRETRTMVMATALNNIPLTTTCDQMLDPQGKVLYAFYEIGTEKLNHLKENAYVSLQWHKPWEYDFSTVLCVQVRGRAQLFDGSSSEMQKGIQTYFSSVPEETRKELASRVEKNMVMSIITIDQVVLFDGVLLTQGMSSYQMWRREDTLTPASYVK